MSYIYSPISERQPLVLPNNNSLALIITFNLEHWDMTKDSDEPYYAGGPPVIPDSLPGRVLDVPNYSWREYGQRVGIWRMIDVMDELKAPASCTMNAKTALVRKQMVDAAKKRNWELVAHNYEQGDLLPNYFNDIDSERKLIKETLAVYKDAVGRPAKGWLSSSLRSTENTPDILAEEGLLFLTDYMNDDQPYLMQTKSKPLVSIPYSVEMNDFTLFHRRGMTTSEVLSSYKEQFDVLLEEGKSSGRIMNIGMHPHISGHPYRIRALREFIKYAQQATGVWWTTREEIAEWYINIAQDHFKQ
ncbi:MAG: Peptidoglycan/xylan/chitin deacetylase, PgdA/CDA1 family [Chloroflexi bacterium]|jgi:allantoinase|nr:MAG: Peptidoglycan/xylan/chitin deacetylase, PgdA/CDA1 family [Chloroflexota bacterium]|tara:strand:- start:3249 stop:4154 length:906 start_codon:yes stop_codon:yes gene_type:complete